MLKKDYHYCIRLITFVFPNKFCHLQAPKIHPPLARCLPFTPIDALDILITAHPNLDNIQLLLSH